MDDKNELRAQVRQVIIDSNGTLPNTEIYNRFVNECNHLQLSEEDFYISILKPAFKSINWEEETAKAEALRAEQKKNEDEIRRKEEEQKKKEAEQRAAIENANAFTERLIETTFAKGVIKAEDLQKIFTKAEEGQQDKFALATLINKQLEAKNYRPYPPASFDAQDLKGLLISTDWYNTQNYPKTQPVAPLQQAKQIPAQKLPVPQAKKTNWGLIILVIVLVVAIPYFISRNSKVEPYTSSQQGTTSDSTTAIPLTKPGLSADTPIENHSPAKRMEANMRDSAAHMDIIPVNPEITQEETQDLVKKFDAFYAAENNSDIPAILGNFSFPVRYYNFKNVDYADLKAIYEASYYSKLKSHHITLDWQDSRIEKTSYGYYLKIQATSDLVLIKHPDKNVHREVNITVILNGQKQITSIYEKK